MSNIIEIERLKKFTNKREILVILILFSILSAIMAPNFLTALNITTIFLQAASLVVVSVGMTFVILNGGIDFSTTSVMAVGSVVGASIMTEDNGLMMGSPFAVPVALIVMMTIGLLFGVVNGFAVTRLKMPSFIATLATMMAGNGFAIWYTRGYSIRQLPRAFTDIGSGSILMIPVPIYIALAVVLTAHFILSKTLFGRQVYAVGTNPKTSFISGVPIKSTVFKLFIISGLCAAIAGIIATARLQSGVATLNSNMFIDIIASIIIGGTSIFGGSGRVSGSVLGALLITVLNNSLNLMGVKWYIINIIKGILVITPAFLDVISHKINERD